MNCDEARTELIAYLKHELAANRSTDLDEHLARCAACRRELEEARRLLSWTEAASNEATIRKVENIINDAIDAGASDVHLDPQNDGGMTIRYRIDGVLSEAGHIESVQRYGVVSRLKMLGEINVSETSIPQDGRLGWTRDEKGYNIRLNTMPQIYGEEIEIRILTRSVSECLPGWKGIGLYDDQIDAIKRLIGQPCGFVLVTGPTGSGRTTTAYTMLKEIASPQRKTMTIEDPVEAVLKWADHSQVNRSAGFTYPRAIQAFLRHDPDVLYVGEMNDSETVDVCLKAASSGHLLISNSFNLTAAGALRLMMNLATHKHLLAFTITGVIAQRLVRKVCEHCAEQYTPEQDDPAIRFLGITREELDRNTIRRGKGCEECRNKGYLGRTAVFEVLTIDRDLSRMLGDEVSMEEIIRVAKGKGFISIVEDAKRKVMAGVTTPDEAMRVLI